MVSVKPPRQVLETSWSLVETPSNRHAACGKADVTTQGQSPEQGWATWLPSVHMLTAGGPRPAPPLLPLGLHTCAVGDSRASGVLRSWGLKCEARRSPTGPAGKGWTSLGWYSVCQG